MQIPKTSLPRIVVIGCGFAGLKFVKTIDAERYQVVLFDRNNYHTFQPLMYQVATAGLEPDSIVYPIRKTFSDKAHFHFRLAEVNEIDRKKKVVHTDIGEVAFDHLVIATGAKSNFFGMDDIAAHSLPMKSLTDSLDLRSMILQQFERAVNARTEQEVERLLHFVIVGAGPTGVELAGSLAELRSHVLPQDYPDLDVSQMKITIIEASGRVLDSMSDHAAATSQKYLERLGVDLQLSTQVKAYDGRTITTSAGTIESDVLVWGAGVQGAPVDGLGVAPVRGNRIAVDAMARLTPDEEIFVLGDVACVSTEEAAEGHPMLASVAGQQGEWLAKNFNRSAKGKAPTPFVYSDKGTMATVGRNLAVVDLGKWQFGGLFAWLTWMFVHLMLLVDFRSRIVVFVNWVWSYINYDRGIRLIIRRKVR